MEEFEDLEVDCPEYADCYPYFNLSAPSNETVGNGTAWEIVVMCATSGILGLIILATIIGNVFVIAAVFFEKNLQNVANYLVVSLALADLAVACLVMPLGAVYEIAGKWILGPIMCEIWTSSDVLCCTASILHLVAIAVDRYFAVTDVEYIRARNKTRINLMILMVWLVAILVSISPIFGWKDYESKERDEAESKCKVSQDMGYQIFATMATFYVPLIVILLLYWKIWIAARKRIRHRPGKINVRTEQRLPNSVSLSPCQPHSRESTADLNPSPELTPDNQGAMSELASPSTIEINLENETSTSHEIQMSTLSPSPSGMVATISLPIITTTPAPPHPPKKRNKESIEAKRERKAAHTLAIITGAFVICWLPFFLMALIMTLCQNYCVYPEYVETSFLWLGYFNSTLNPIIYTIFSPEFRSAFKKILCGTARYR